MIRRLAGTVVRAGSRHHSRMAVSSLQTSCLLPPAHSTSYHTTSVSFQRCVRDISESDFDLRADEFLEDLMDGLEDLESTAGPEFEIDYAMGVLTLVLDENTTYVLNKQRPNRQVWMSSPTSGPRRFELDDDGDSWVDVRSRENLLQIMTEELNAIAPEVDLDLT